MDDGYENFMRGEEITPSPNATSPSGCVKGGCAFLGYGCAAIVLLVIAVILFRAFWVLTFGS